MWKVAYACAGGWALRPQTRQIYGNAMRIIIRAKAKEALTDSAYRESCAILHSRLSSFGRNLAQEEQSTVGR